MTLLPFFLKVSKLLANKNQMQQVERNRSILAKKQPCLLCRERHKEAGISLSLNSSNPLLRRSSFL